jgi:hypothetical protein
MNAHRNWWEKLTKFLLIPLTNIGRLIRHADTREFRVATLNIAKRADRVIEVEQDELGNQVTKRLRKSFRDLGYDFVVIDPVKKNGTAYTIFIREKTNDGTIDEVIIHIDFHQYPFPIIVRGLYSGGFWSDEECYSKDAHSIAMMIHRVTQRIRAGGYLLKPPKAVSQQIDIVGLVLS